MSIHILLTLFVLKSISWGAEPCLSPFSSSPHEKPSSSNSIIQLKDRDDIEFFETLKSIERDYIRSLPAIKPEIIKVDSHKFELAYSLSSGTPLLGNAIESPLSGVTIVNTRTAQVFLTYDLKHVVKIYSPEQEKFYLKEKLLTEFFERHHIPVAPIITFDDEKRILVKPYIRGAEATHDLYNFITYHGEEFELSDEIKDEIMRKQRLLIQSEIKSIRDKFLPSFLEERGYARDFIRFGEMDYHLASNRRLSLIRDDLGRYSITITIIDL